MKSAATLYVGHPLIQWGRGDTLRVRSHRGVIRDIADTPISDQVITIAMMSERFGKTPQAVAPAMQKLVDLGSLSGPYGSYGRQYIADDVFHAVTAPPGRVPARDDPLQHDTGADPSRL